MILWLAVAEFLCGALMFSYWLGKLARKDLKRVGDGNPGAFNLWRAAGYRWGLAGIALDFLKGYVPLAILIESGTLGRDYGMTIVAAAPILGHAFSPFLKFKGGKAIAVTFGVWSALTRFEAALVYAVILAALLAGFTFYKKGKYASREADGFQVVIGMVLLSIYLLAAGDPPAIWGVWLVNLMVLAYANRQAIRVFLTGKSGKLPRSGDGVTL
ncbi:glycerol-3-phosphate acyltransferase [Paenibacillus rubinfantis]|uniref:glycerol-3-phosphate acyltransferase n=1 Tax=Paenibacillus rubinfantis TaxID=1720296 RepID=UPI00073F769F|nr:glycerol-3-phosphate acyltransferase [Paenibacillus rubinfantis]